MRACLFVAKIIVMAGLALGASLAVAATAAADNTTITFVSVNGGTDTANAGTTCISVANAVSASCTGGYVAIPNNNSQLLSAALAAKSSGAKIWLYYSDAATTNFHCPGLVLTPCSAISIGIKQ
jgi:uncharacterized membrane-anchored protein